MSMLRHRHRRGRRSEREAYVGFFDHGELVLATGVGVRVHGGASRDRRGVRHLRLVPRRRYGAPEFSPAPFPESAELPAARLVLRRNRGPDRQRRMWNFTSPLSLDVMRRVGVPAPRSRPTLLVLNGVDQGVYEISEYIGREFVEDRFGLEQFVLVRTKQNHNEPRRSRVKEGPEEPYEEFEERTRALPETGQERAGEWVNVDNLYRWAFGATFLDTRDMFQGTLVRDLADPEARWFWIAWDLDISFGLPHLPTQDGWRTDSLAVLLDRPRPDPRRWLFIWLMKSPAERHRFATLAMEMLNHRLDDRFVSERIAFYRGQAELYQIEDRRFLDEIEDYLRNRPRAYRQSLSQTFALGPPRGVRVSGPPGARLEIDGHLTELPWQGEYFDGMSVRLAAPAGTVLSVDGEARTLGAGPLEIAPRDDLEVVVTHLPG